MKKFLYIFPILFMIMVSCIDNGQKTAPSSDPVIESVTLNYSQLNKTLFISAEVTDPQGWETIDSVVFYLYRKDSVDSVEEPLFRAGQLVDIGPPLDIINRDNVYSYLIDSTTLADNDGYYRVTVQAFDSDGNSSDIETKSELVAPNSPPEIFPLYVSDSFEKGDTLIFKLRITDQQGSQDIASVTYSVFRPDDEFISDPSFYLSDAGPAGGYGDQYANDGVYTVYQPSNPNSELQGLYIFYFVAKDIHGATSDTLKESVMNPGVILTSPNYADTLYTTHTYRIEWESAYISSLKIEYTTNANAGTPSYKNITTVTASTGYYDWEVPYSTSSHCKVRISDPAYPNRYDVSDNEFQIIP
ncbi:MAG: hypothetical protein KAU06_04630 [Candidatus Marinimicrobia bacterium]|nr:hypothetical protein [Candidatus Neomarinimicrobiota bacterium]